jgi:hypothetical protein
VTLALTQIFVLYILIQAWVVDPVEAPYRWRLRLVPNGYEKDYLTNFLCSQQPMLELEPTTTVELCAPVGSSRDVQADEDSDRFAFYAHRLVLVILISVYWGLDLCDEQLVKPEPELRVDSRPPQVPGRCGCEV